VQSSDGVTVALHDLGGSGAPFLVCHATGFCGGAYGPLAEHLALERHVWALDFRGHGDSTAPTGDRYDWDGAADDLEAVVDAVTDEPVDVFGHSMGGAAAMILERRRPGTVRSAYLFEPIIVPAERPTTVQNPLAEAARRRRAVFPSKGAALLRYATKTPLRVLNAAALAAYVEHGFEDLPDGTARLKLDPAQEAAVFEAAGKATIDTVRGLDVPVVVAVGVAEGEWGPATFGPAIVDAMPNARLESFPRLGHFGPLEDPGWVAERVLASL
jgi:pimeloyl-ACP methyl ester carboxylesterase